VNVYKKFLHIIKQHAEALLLYEILMRSIGFLIGALMVLLFDLSFRQSHGDILINTDLLGFFEGYRLLFLTLAIFTVIYVSLVEIVGLCYISVHEEKGAHILAALRYSAKRSASILHAYGLHVICAIFLCVFFFPIFDIGPAYLRTISVPTFVTDEISRYAYLPYVYTAIAIGIFIFLFRSAFTFHIFALNKKDFVSAIRDSWRITRRKAHIKELLKWGVLVPAAIFGAMIMLTSLLSYGVLSILNAIAVAFISIFPQGISLALYTSWIYLLSTAISLMIGPILIGLLSAYLLTRVPEALDADIIAEAKSFSIATETDLKESINVASNGYMDSRAVIRMLRRPALVMLFGAISFLTFSYVSSRFLYVYDGKPERPVLISHRGMSGIQENSIEAFSAFQRNFENDNPNQIGIETDLQILSDGTVIIYHDADFGRLYGIDKKVIDTSLADFDDMFGMTTSPILMTDLLDYILEKNLCPALLEIKVYEDIESAQAATALTVEEIKKRNLESCIYLGSLDQRIVTYIEEIDPSIQSNQYIYTKAGDIGKIEVADALSLEYSLANERLVRALKKSGKKIFVWTLNERSIAEQMYAYGIDGIITDNPDAIEAAFESYEELMSHIDPKIVTLFGKTFLVDLKDVWQFKLRFPFI
jgi:glycerophosphoryl diester phosphodiesterase